MVTRKQYSKEFKLDAISLVQDQGFTIAEAARSLEINTNMLRRWIKEFQAGLIVHSDRGSQYASKAYRRLLKSHGYIGSMSRLGNCWNNSVAESFFGSLKQERCQWRHYQTRYAAQQC
ncbi:transposase [Nitrosomonas aestuarii]|nr:transposase [Nitrosomonas aestuarii]